MFTTSKQVEATEKEKSEMELKKKSLERELLKAAEYLKAQRSWDQNDFSGR